MSVVRINAVEVKPEMAPMFEERFAKRAGSVEQAPGFEAFELLKPTDEGSRYFVYTRWASEEAYQSWLDSQDFARTHAHPAPAAGGAAQPVGQASEVLAFEVVERVGRA